MDSSSEIFRDSFRKKSYDIERSTFRSMTFFTIKGQELEYEDLFEIVGKHRYTPCFTLKPGSESFERFGECITGRIFYTKKELEKLESKYELGPVKALKIEAAMLEITQIQSDELKYKGIQISDIESLTFCPWATAKEYHDTGETVVPNVITIPIHEDLSRRYNGFVYHLLTGKLHDGVELLDFQKEKLVGIILGMENNQIDPRLLERLGMDPATVGGNENVRFHRHSAKARMQELSEREKADLASAKELLFLVRFNCLLKEIIAANPKSDEDTFFGKIIEDIKPALETFEPEVLLTAGKKQVYWDFASYVHIVFRHVKQFQVGGFKTKTPFPYKFEDLKLLLQKVLDTIDGEIERHFIERPGTPFSRHGRMAASFNGDYYCVDIEADGRIATIYMVGDQKEKDTKPT